MKKVVWIVFIVMCVSCQQAGNEEATVSTKAEEFEVGSYTMRGIPDRVAFIDAPWVEGEAQKYMWHFWGSEDELTGPFKVTGTQMKTGETVTVFEAREIAGPVNGADASLPSNMSLPESGEWKLETSMDGEAFGTILVHVKE
ncbi:DUF4871 domain-containing protein [Halobacillus litoralis]|uniref:DUF4871 domain-containing protein n=1 Tax=Halobacillus litoralis TaxID=45668 RepID=UPI001CFD2692|nr:DUF4871 domain-containing protein [Halobacillus litoralis]WLR46446.1 DUF4871 domain-containing protein [Halobacillus litoralis]